MLDKNAQIIFEVKAISKKLLMIKSPLSQEILLTLAIGGGTYEMRKIFKAIEATSTAIRLHIQTLIDEDFIELSVHEDNRRCKIIELTPKGWKLMKEFEKQVQQEIELWQKI